jgi:hypothetical protein
MNSGYYAAITGLMSRTLTLDTIANKRLEGNPISSTSSSCERKPSSPERKSFGLNLSAHFLILLGCALLAGCGSVNPSMQSPANGAVPTINSFTAGPESIISGSSSLLSWATSGAETIAIAPGTFTSTSTSGSVSVSPTLTTTYTLTATDPAGSVTSLQTITVDSEAKPTISSFTASPASVNSGSSSTLSWTTSGAASIAIAPGTFTSTSASGSTSVSPTATTTYTLTATNAAGSATSTVNRYRNQSKQTNDQLLHGQSREHQLRFQQHAELGDDRRDEYRHRAGNIHVHIGERFNEREPNGDDHLHADGHQCGRFGHVYGTVT